MVLIPQFEKPHRKKKKYMVTRLHIFPAYEKQQATALLRVYRYNDIIRYNNKFNNNNNNGFIAPRSQVRNKSEWGRFFYL